MTAETSAREILAAEEDFAWNSWFLPLVELHSAEDPDRLAIAVEVHSIPLGMEGGGGLQGHTACSALPPTSLLV